MSEDFHLSYIGSQARLELSGNWQLERLAGLEQRFSKLDFKDAETIIIDGSGLQQLDTAGIMLLLSGFREGRACLPKLEFNNFRESDLNLIEMVDNRLAEPVAIKGPAELSFTQRVGRSTLVSLSRTIDLLGFIGLVFRDFWKLIKTPKLFRTKELVAQLELVLVDAIPVVCLVTFLIGVVIAYLFAAQISQYGANIFIVDSVGLAICRELSPILVAIVVAGRSGSAFTAQLGTMKLNEEIDALSTIGLSPMHVLVIPRILALIIAMPLLVMLGDIVGVVGGIIVGKFQLGISLTTFLDRLQIVLPLASVFVGLTKAPVFAAFIAIIGCRMGLIVERNARSLGLNTTSTVVQSIVSVILINAAFAILYVQLGI